MPLVQDERTTCSAAELLLSDGPLPVSCRITVERLQGVHGPTWYGYFIPHDHDLSVLPGRYHVRMHDVAVAVLVRRPCLLGGNLSFPFWGLDDPPTIPDSDLVRLEPPLGSPEGE
jgi:hypothetical protein